MTTLAANTLLQPSEADDTQAIVEAYLYAAKGDARAALTQLASDAVVTVEELRTRLEIAEQSVSFGYVQGAFGPLRSERHEDEPVRHRRHFSENDSAAFLAALGECRRACLAAHTNAPIGGPVYRAVSRLMQEIDLMAETLTGDRSHFHLGPCGPFGAKPKGPKSQGYDAEFDKVRRRYDAGGEES
jgi:hypothetical protein